MKKVLKTILILFGMLVFVVTVYFLYIYKPNNLNPEDTIKKYINYWKDDFTIGMKSLESKKADFVDVIRNLHKSTQIENISIQDKTDKELSEIYNQYNGKFSKENLKIYSVKFKVKSDDKDWEGVHTFNFRLVHEKQGWLVLSFGYP